MSAAIAAAVLGIMVVSYLAWVTSEYRLSKRSHAWSQALNLCEAGVELALAEYNCKYVYDPASAFASANGWQTAGSTSTRTVSNFTDSTGRVVGSVDITVTGISAKFPVIMATATATAPGATAVTRNLRVVAKERVTYPSALAAKQTLKLSASSTLLVDSFDSRDPAKSTGSLYDVAKRQANGNIACLDTSSSSVTLKGVDIYGHVATGVGGQVVFNNGSSVGATFDNLQRSTTQAGAVAAGWESHDFIMDMPTPVVPAALLTAANMGAIKGGETFVSGDYRIDSLKNSSGDVTINGNVRIYCTGAITLLGVSKLYIAPGASLEIFVLGSITVSGNGIVNGSGLAANNTWYGLASTTTFDLSGSSQYVGTIYAPLSTVKLGGSADYVGGFVGNTVEVTGSSSVHFDEALTKGGVHTLGFTALSWQPLVNRGGTWVIETN